MKGGFFFGVAEGGAAEKKLRGKGVKSNGGRKGVGFHSALKLAASLVHTHTPHVDLDIMDLEVIEQNVTHPKISGRLTKL